MQERGKEGKVMRKAMQVAARLFLDYADKHNEEISRYIDGCNDRAALKAWEEIEKYSMVFRTLYSVYYDEPMVDHELVYDMAEAVLGYE